MTRILSNPRKLRTSGIALAAFCFSVPLAAQEPSTADAEPAQSETIDAVSTDRRILPVRDLLSPVDSLKLSGLEDEVVFQLHVPADSKVNEATLHLGYVNSDRLLPDNSALELSINDALIARLPITGNSRMVRGTIEVPPDWFRPGLNQLRINAHQRHRAGCDVALEGEMWTEINASASHLRLSMDRTGDWNGLASLDTPGWAWTPAGKDVEIMTTSLGMNEELVEIGALAAGAFALRGGGWPVTFKHRRIHPSDLSTTEGETVAGDDQIIEGDLASADNDRSAANLQALIDDNFGSHIVIGLREELLPFLGAELVGVIDGPFLAYLPREPETAGGFLIISGRNNQEMRSAAMRLADLEAAMPSLSYATVEPVDEILRYETTFIENERVYDFAELGFSMTNDSRQRGTIYLQLPETYFVADNRRAEMRLNFAYRRDLPPNTRLNILVNGEPADTIKLTNPNGQIVHNGRVALPLRSFRPGGNEITFQPTLGSGTIADCDRVDDPGDWIEIFPSSTLSVPPGADIEGQRDLNIVRSLGYPFGDPTRPSPWLVLPDPDENSVSAAWTLIGQISQTLGVPLTDLRATTSMPNPGAGDAILVGARHLIPQDLLIQSGLDGGIFRKRSSEDDEVLPEPLEVVSRLGQDLEIASPNVAIDETPQWLGELGSNAPMSRDMGVGTWIGSALGETQNDIRRLFSQVAYRTGIPLQRERLFGVHDGGIAITQDGSDQDFHVLILTAADGAELKRAGAALIRPQVWDKLHGTAAGWVADPPRVITVETANPIEFTNLPKDPKSAQIQINNMLAAHPERWLIASLGLIFVVGIAMRAVFPGRRDE